MIVALVAAFLLPADLSMAAPIDAAITLDPNVGPPTTRVHVSGTGFGADERVILKFDGARIARSMTGGDGSFTKSVTVPAAATPGDHVVSARGRDSGLTASATFRVRTDWSQFQFDPAKTGLNPYENVLGVSNVGGLALAWTHKILQAMDSSPVVAGDIVYVSSFTDRRFWALKDSNGSKLWMERLGVSSAAVANGIVYVGNSFALTAADAVTGTVLWSFRTGNDARDPTVVDGTVYFASKDKNVYAVDATTGALRWYFTTSGGSDGAVGSPAVAGGVVYVGDAHGTFYALDATTGELIWKFAAGGWPVAAVADGIVYVAGSAFYALDAADGTLLWSHPNGSGPPALWAGSVYVTNGDGTFALDADTGDEIWHAPTGSTSGAVVANGVVYVTSEQGIDSVTLHALDGSSGTELFAYTIDKYSVSLPAVADGTVYVGAQSTVYAFRLP